MSTLRERANNPEFSPKVREFIISVADELDWLDENTDTQDGEQWESRMRAIETVAISLESFVAGYRACKGNR